jgi:hypothetical protein
MFTGFIEFAVGALLLYRRTVTLGLLIGLGVYTNVLIMNLGYDIPVKLFSAHLVLMCLYLLTGDIERLANFFIFNRPTAQSMLYHLEPKKAGRKLRLAIKFVFLLAVAYLIAGPYNHKRRQSAMETREIAPIPYGFYDVTAFVKNGDTLPVLANDRLIWKDIIFERGNKVASVNSCDTLFKQISSRGMFYYRADTIKSTMRCYKQTAKGNVTIFTLRYRLSRNKKQVQMWVGLKKDSIYLKLEKNNRKFILAQKPFHWLLKGQ